MSRIKQGASDYFRRSKIPTGFQDLLETFVVEILRDNPGDLIDFGAKYFSTLEEVIISYLKSIC